MTRLLQGVGLVLLPLAAGCVQDDKVTVVQPGTGAAVAQTARLQHAPATEEVAVRVANLGRKVVQANPQLGLRPAFICIGAPQPVLFHRLGRDACEVVISEGLARQCQTEGQLAAVLCTELGRVASERATLARSTLQTPPDPPPAMPVTRDEAGTFGGADGTRLAELARYDRLREQASQPVAVPPSPEVLARAYLLKAGYAASDLTAITALVRATEKDVTFEKQMTGKQ
jgi:hypothetical protein